MIYITLEKFKVIGFRGRMDEWSFDSKGGVFTANAVSKLKDYEIEYILSREGSVCTIYKLLPDGEKTVDYRQTKQFQTDGSGIVKLGGGIVKNRRVGFMNADTVNFLSAYNIDNIRTFERCGNRYYLKSEDQDNRLHNIIYIPRDSSYVLHMDDEEYKFDKLLKPVSLLAEDFPDSKEVYIVFQKPAKFIILEDHLSFNRRTEVRRNMIIHLGAQVFSYKEQLEDMKYLLK